MAGTVKRDNIKGICLHEFDTVVVFIYIIFIFNLLKEKRKLKTHVAHVAVHWLGLGA